MLGSVFVLQTRERIRQSVPGNAVGCPMWKRGDVGRQELEDPAERLEGRPSGPGQANFTGLVLGCIEADFCK